MHTYIYSFFLKIFDISDTYADTSDTSQSSTSRLKAKLKEPSSSNSVENTETSKLSIDKFPLSIPNPEQDIQPLLNKFKIGSKQQRNIKTSAEVEEIVSN